LEARALRDHVHPKRSLRLAPAVIVALGAAIAAALPGCAASPTLQVRGYPEADVLVENPVGSGEMVYVGRTAGVGTLTLDYELPEVLMNARVKVRVTSSLGTFDYVVYTDRSPVVHYPPEAYLDTEDPGSGVEVLRPAQRSDDAGAAKPGSDKRGGSGTDDLMTGEGE
jgi:hypothetical protein